MPQSNNMYQLYYNLCCKTLPNHTRGADSISGHPRGEAKSLSLENVQRIARFTRRMVGDDLYGGRDSLSCPIVPPVIVALLVALNWLST